MSCGRWLNNAQVGDWATHITLIRSKLTHLHVISLTPGTQSKYFRFNTAEGNKFFANGKDVNWNGKYPIRTSEGLSGTITVWKDDPACNMSCGRWLNDAKLNDWNERISLIPRIEGSWKHGRISNGNRFQYYYGMGLQPIKWPDTISVEDSKYKCANECYKNEKCFAASLYAKGWGGGSADCRLFNKAGSKNIAPSGQYKTYYYITAPKIIKILILQPTKIWWR